MVPKALTMGGWGFFGDLKSFQRAFDAGHDVQMHGTCAINKLSREEYPYLSGKLSTLKK